MRRRTSSFTAVPGAELNRRVAVGRGAVCVRRGHSELADGEWQCYAECSAEVCSDVKQSSFEVGAVIKKEPSQ